MTRRPLAFVLALALACVSAALGWGCGGNDGSTTPAADAGADANIALPDPPAPPGPPVLTPCATGWRETATPGEPTTCEPWPESGHADCASIDEAHFPGTPGCSRIGPACPPGDFPEDLPPGTPVRYVLASAAPGGDGTVGRPFATVTAALVGITSGTIVAVGKGSYDEGFDVPGGVTVWGACVRETVLRASTPGALSRTPVVGFRRAGGALRNVRINASVRHAVYVDGRLAEATLDAVEIDGGSRMGIGANAGHLVLHDVVLRDLGSRGLEIVQGATAEATRVVIERVHELGAYVAYGATVRLEDSVVRAILPAPGGAPGMGVNLQDGATLEASRLVVEDVHDSGIVALTASSLTLTDSVVRDVAERTSDGELGNGLSIESGSSATVSRVLVERATENGLLIMHPGTSVSASDLVVRDILGHAAVVSFGRGVSTQFGATLTVERAWIARARELGLFVAGADARATFTDVTVLDTSENGEGRGGRGLSVQEPGASAEVVRAEFARNREISLASHEGTTLRLTDVTVRDTVGRAGDGVGGDAIASDNGDIEGTRVLVERSTAFGVLALGPGANVRLSQLTVRDTTPVGCMGVSCTDAAHGVGVGAVWGGTLSVDAFAVVSATVCGALVAEGSSVDLVHGQVRGCAIGACVQSVGYDSSRLALDVLYADNGRTLDTTSLPVPDAVPPL